MKKLCLLCSTLHVGAAFSQTPHELGKLPIQTSERPVTEISERGLTLNHEASFLLADEADMSIESIVERFQSGAFSSTQGLTTFYRNAKEFWLHIPVRLDPPGRRIVFTLDDTSFTFVDFYLFTGGKLIRAKKAGSFTPKQEKYLHIRRAFFDARLIEGIDYELYIRVTSSLNIVHPSVRAFTPKQFREMDHVHQWILGLYYGAAIAIIFYNVFLFITTRDRNFFHYVVFLFSVCVTLAILDGMIDVLFPGYGFQRCLVTLGDICIFLALNFTRRFIETPKIAPKFDFVLRLLMCSCVVGGVLGMFEIVYSGVIMDFNLAASALAVLTTGAIAVNAGSVSARYFLSSWVFLCPFCIAWVAMMQGVLPYSPWTIYGIHLGSAIEMVLMSLGLGSRLTRAQTETIESLKRAVASEAIAESGRMVAHDARKPFALLESLLKQIEQGASGDPHNIIAGYAPRLRQTMNEANQMLNDLVAAETRKLFQIEPHNLNDIIKRAIKQVFPEGVPNGLTLENNVKADTIVLVDRVQITRVMANLLENAKHATGEQGTITILTEHHDPHIKIIVINTGPAIPVGLEEEIFEASFTRKETGTGLGLAISREIVTGHHGKIYHESRGGMTSFVVELETRDKIKNDTATDNPKTIIVADDCLLTRESWTKTVKDAEVVTVNRPEAVLDWLASTDRSRSTQVMVVMDLHFDSSQASEGKAAAKQISDEGTPVFISTNQAQRVDADLPQIEKRPYSWQELKELV